VATLLSVGNARPSEKKKHHIEQSSPVFAHPVAGSVVPPASLGSVILAPRLALLRTLPSFLAPRVGSLVWPCGLPSNIPPPHIPVQ
jgi:hypothetical protein